jgi:hypothetical protein
LAITTTYSGSLALQIALRAAYSGDREGGEEAKIALAIAFAAAGGTAPTLSGFLKGTVTAAAGDLLLAHATDPLQGMGDARYTEGFAVAGTKLKLFFFQNNDPTNSVTIIRGAANGLPIFAAAGDGLTVLPGGVVFLYDPAGLTAALVSGTNDKATLAVSAGAPSCTLLAGYGP